MSKRRKAPALSGRILMDNGGSIKMPDVVHDEVLYPDNWPADLGEIAWNALFVAPDFERTWNRAVASLFPRHCARCAGPEPDWNIHPEFKPGARKTCLRCHGSGVELTALERWDDTAMTLRCYQWPEGTIERVKEQLKPGDMLVAARMFSVEIERDGHHINFNRT